MIKEEIAARMAARNSGEFGVIDPISITVYLTILIQVVKLWKECQKTEEEVIVACCQPSPREINALKRRIRRTVGIRRYNQDGEQILANVMGTAKDLTRDEINELML